MHIAGDRVGAISHSEGDTIYFFGYGVYEGDFVPDTAAGYMGDILRSMGHLNPKITLDSGKVVWGCECYWDDEASIQETLKDKTVVEADIDETRARVCQSRVEIPEDEDFIRINEEIGGEFPQLEQIKAVLVNILRQYVGVTSKLATLAITSEIVAALNVFVNLDLIEGLGDFSITTEGTTTEIDLTLVMPPDGKNLNFNVVLQNQTTEPS